MSYKKTMWHFKNLLVLGPARWLNGWGYFVAMSDNLSLILGTHMVERENWFLKLFSGCHMCLVSGPLHTYTHTLIYLCFGGIDTWPECVSLWRCQIPWSWNYRQLWSVIWWGGFLQLSGREEANCMKRTKTLVQVDLVIMDQTLGRLSTRGFIVGLFNTIEFGKGFLGNNNPTVMSIPGTQ